MILRFEAYQDYWQVNRTALVRYLKLFLLIAIAGAGYFLLQEKYRYLAIAVAGVIFLVLVAYPRLAVYQYIILMFSNVLLSESPVILFLDLSACVVVCAALLDFFLEHSPPGGFPKLTLNWALLLVVIFVTSVTGYNFMAGVRPLARLILMTVTFLSLYRLSRHFTLKHIITVFFWVAVANAIFALLPLITTGRIEREFGLGAKTLDDMMMLTLPMGLILYLLSDRGAGVKYLLGAGMIFIALLVTQSRFPLIFALASSVMALVLVKRVAGRSDERNPGDKFKVSLARTGEFVKRRAWQIAVFSVILVAAVIAVYPDMLLAVWGRFGQLVTHFRSGTVAPRLLLWKTALTAFWDNPVLGVGPGNFNIIHTLYLQLHLDPFQIYIQGLSAHNLVLHYLAETGLFGTSVLVALLVNQFRLARVSFRKASRMAEPEVLTILFVVATVFLVTAFFEAAWMWGQMSFVFVFFLALIVRAHERVANVSSAH